MTEPGRSSVGISIRTRLVGAIGGLVAVLAAMLFVYLPARLTDEASAAFERRARDTAMIVASAAAAGLEFEDAPGAHAALGRLSSSSDLVYALVLRPDGSTFAAWNPKAAGVARASLSAAEALAADAPSADVAVPIHGREGDLGQLRLGISLASLVEQRAATRGAVATSAAALLSIGLLLAWLIGSVLARPLVALTCVAERIASDGDLSQTIDVSSSDEIGQLARSIARLVENLRGVPLRLQESTRLLADAVVRLRGAADAQGDVLQRQAAALQETQVTAEQMRQAAQVAAERANGVLLAAERADALGRDGAASVLASIGALEQLRSQVSSVSDQLSALGGQTRAIQSVTEKVKSLADQSNMLALNAAIEAVRSGEQGKGFAVVAREMRGLADKSIAQTVEVRRILEGISEAIDRANTTSSSGQQRMEAGLVQVGSSGRTIRELGDIVTVNAGAARQIAAALSQQAQGVGQITAAMRDLTLMMGDTMTRLDETRHAVDLLGEAASNVDAVVAGFRV